MCGENISDLLSQLLSYNTVWLTAVTMLYITIPVIIHPVDIVQSLGHIQVVATPQTAACQASLSFTISQSWLKLMFIDSVIMNHLIHLIQPSLSLLPPSPPALHLFQHQGLFQWVSYSWQILHFDQLHSFFATRPCPWQSAICSLFLWVQVFRFHI